MKNVIKNDKEENEETYEDILSKKVANNDIGEFLYDFKKILNDNSRHNKGMLFYMLDDFYYFTKYGEKILKLALEKNNSVIIEKVFDLCLDYFRKDTLSNFSLLKIIILELPRLEKDYPKLVSKFFIQTSIIFFNDNITQT